MSSPKAGNWVLLTAWGVKTSSSKLGKLIENRTDEGRVREEKKETWRERKRHGERERERERERDRVRDMKREHKRGEREKKGEEEREASDWDRK